MQHIILNRLLFADGFALVTGVMPDHGHHQRYGSCVLFVLHGPLSCQLFRCVVVAHVSKCLFVLFVPVSAVVSQAFIGTPDVLQLIIHHLFQIVKFGLILSSLVQSFIRGGHVIHDGFGHVHVRTRVGRHSRAVAFGVQSDALLVFAALASLFGGVDSFLDHV